jgi:hypothetical protein
VSFGLLANHTEKIVFLFAMLSWCGPLRHGAPPQRSCG